MDEEEDWDTPEDKSPAKTASSQPSDSSAPQLTLKITDGYKYSYEAHASPANIDDWIDPPSYGGGRRSNGYSQNSFRDRDRDRDNNRLFDRNDANARFNAVRRNDSFPNDSRSFGAPKSNRFQNRGIPAPVPDWDAPDPSANQINGSWKPPIVNTPTTAAADEEDWDAPEGTPSQSNRGTPKVADIPIFNPNSSRNKSQGENWDTPMGGPSKASKPIPVLDSSRSAAPSISAASIHDDENWDDEPSGTQPVAPVVDIPTFRPQTTPIYKDNSTPAYKDNSTPVYQENATPVYKDNTTSNISLTNNEENWDDDAPGPSKPGNGFVEIPTFRPGGTPSNQRYDNQSSDSQSKKGFGDSNDSFQPTKGFGDSNDFQRKRGFGDSNDFQPTKGFGDSNDRYGNSNDHFGREPFRRHSRGNRHNPYERNDRGGFRGRGRGGDRGDRGFDRGYDRNFERGFDRGFDRGGRGGDRGGRGGDRGFRGRGGRDNFQSPYSRDGSRSRDRGDRSYQNSFNRNNDRSPYQAAPPPSFNNQPEEDWDSPTGFKQTNPPPATENNDAPTSAPTPAPAPAPSPSPGGALKAVPIEQTSLIAVATEESWD